jgi:hypothetical protein
VADVTGCVGNVAVLIDRPRRQMRKPGADVEHDRCKPQRPILSRRALRLTAQLNGECLKEQPRSHGPTEMVQQRNAENGSSLMPNPSLGNRRLGRLHCQVPLRDDGGRDNGQDESAETLVRVLVGAVQQGRRHKPEKK